MRRSLVTLTLFASAAMAGCDEGPSQPYSAAPSGAGAIWNNGNADASLEQGTASLDAGFPTVSLLQGCSADKQRAVWGAMLQKEVTPVYFAGVNFYGSADIADAASPTNFGGTTIGAAQLVNCNVVPQGMFGCQSGLGTCYYGNWGLNGEVNIDWSTQTSLIDYMQLNTGYTGAFTFTSKTTVPGISIYESLGNTVGMQAGDQFEFYVSQPPKVKLASGGGWQSFNIPWTNKDINQVVNALYSAILDTWADSVGVPWQGGVSGLVGPDCVAAGNCLLDVNDGPVTVVGFRPMAFYMLYPGNVQQPVASSPSYYYSFFVKNLPYSHMPQVLKLDHEGPIAQSDLLATLDDGGASGSPCMQRIGLQFGDPNNPAPGTLLHDCVNVTGAASTDLVQQNKLLGGITHDYEHFTLNVVGINQNFTKADLPWSSVVMDSQHTPGPNDTAQDWTFDVRTSAADWNDYQILYGARQFDARGMALVYVEWANLMLADIAQMRGLPQKTVGDPSCWVGNSQKLPSGCSGIEGLMIPTGSVGDNNGFPAPQQFPNSALIPNQPVGSPYSPGGPNLAYDNGAHYTSKTKLTPGDQIAVFCDAPGDCVDYQASGVSPFQMAQSHVIRRMGNGDPNNLPPELRDRRYYYKWFAIAYAKYLKAFGDMYSADTANYTHPAANQAVRSCDITNPGLGTPAPTVPGLCPSNVHGETIDLEGLFFDNIEGNGFDLFEYVDRTNMPATDPGNASPQPGASPPTAAVVGSVPWDFQFGDDLIGGNQRYTHFYQRLDREEIVMYEALLEDKTHLPGYENNMTLTNLFGSQIIAGNWPNRTCALAQGDPNLDGCPAPAPMALNPSPPSTCPSGKFPTQGMTFGLATATAGAPVWCGTPCPLSGICPSSDPTNPVMGCFAAEGPASQGPGGTYCYDTPADDAVPCLAGDICATAGDVCVMGAAGLVCINPAPANRQPDPVNGCAALSATAAPTNSVSAVACAPLLQDLNGQLPTVANPDAGVLQVRPYLYRYLAAAGGNTVFSAGHSPIRERAAGAGHNDEQPGLGVTTVVVPNFTSPYAAAVEQLADAGTCTAPFVQDLAYPTLCTLPQTLVASLQNSTVNILPSGAIQSLVPYYPLSYSIATGSGIAIPDPTPNTMRNYIYPAAQYLFNGVLESYNVWYEPFVDTVGPATCTVNSDCATANGFSCNLAGQCVDDTVIIDGIQATDFLGDVFLCQASNGDILKARMYDSAAVIVSWLQNHPGNEAPSGAGFGTSAQFGCGIVLRYSPYDNQLDYVASTAYGVTLEINPGQGQFGRVVGATVYNPSLAGNANN